MSEVETEEQRSSKGKWIGGFISGVLILVVVLVIKRLLHRNLDEDYVIDTSTPEA